MNKPNQDNDTVLIEALKSHRHWFGDKLRNQLHDTPHMTLEQALAQIKAHYKQKIEAAIGEDELTRELSVKLGRQGKVKAFTEKLARDQLRKELRHKLGLQDE